MRRENSHIEKEYQHNNNMAIDQCDICTEKIQNNEKAIECESCNRWQHVECSGLTKREFEIAKSKNCKMTWLCAECKPRILKGENIERQLIANLTSQIQTVMAEMMSNIEQKITDKIQNAIRKELRQHTRPTVIKEKAPTPPIMKQQSPQETNSDPAVETRETDRKENDTQEKQDEMQESQATLAPQPPSTLDGTERREESGTDIVIKRNANIVGSKQTTNGKFKAGTRKAWLYIGRIHETTTTEDIITFLEEGGIDGQIECQELTTKGRNKSFMLGINLEEKEKTDNPDFWPQDVIVRQYRFRGQQSQGALFRRR